MKDYPCLLVSKLLSLLPVQNFYFYFFNLTAVPKQHKNYSEESESFSLYMIDICMHASLSMHA